VAVMASLLANQTAAAALSKCRNSIITEQICPHPISSIALPTCSTTLSTTLMPDHTCMYNTQEFSTTKDAQDCMDKLYNLFTSRSSYIGTSTDIENNLNQIITTMESDYAINQNDEIKDIIYCRLLNIFHYISVNLLRAPDAQSAPPQVDFLNILNNSLNSLSEQTRKKIECDLTKSFPTLMPTIIYNRQNQEATSVFIRLIQLTDLHAHLDKDTQTTPDAVTVENALNSIPDKDLLVQALNLKNSANQNFADIMFKLIDYAFNKIWDSNSIMHDAANDRYYGNDQEIMVKLCEIDPCLLKNKYALDGSVENGINGEWDMPEVSKCLKSFNNSSENVTNSSQNATNSSQKTTKSQGSKPDKSTLSGTIVGVGVGVGFVVLGGLGAIAAKKNLFPIRTSLRSFLRSFPESPRLKSGGTSETPSMELADTGLIKSTDENRV
tara:strand:- start:698 stop:2014 length:1317 start_codon:yes stop_codon:yes gene_type:complete